MGWGTLVEVRSGSGELREGPGRVVGPAGRSGTGRGTLGSPGRVKGPSVWSGTALGTIWEVRDGSGEPRGGPGRDARPSGRSETGRNNITSYEHAQGNLGEVRVGSVDPRESGTGQRTLGVVRDGTRDHLGSPGRVGGTSRRSGTGRGTLGDVRDVSGDPREGPRWVEGPSGRYRTGRGTLREV